MRDIGLSGWLFFQAEDGIRDLVRSRGLGDVYKRQVIAAAMVHDVLEDTDITEQQLRQELGDEVLNIILPPVSYTHLTLPTSDLV